jgi:pimeloyl-ACP methyl ester carboxylesterase
LPGARASFNLPFAIVAVMLTAIAFCLATDHMRFGRVNIGGPDLRVWITGHGKPTVVFESGAGATLETWVTIQPEVAKFAQTFSYDRAGNGRSDKGTEPRDGIHVANELHTALRNAGMPPPYVMVGHSLGGPYIRIFAGLYSNEVAGMVLVDPTQEEVIAWAEDHGHRKPHEHKLRPSDEVDCAPSTFAQASQHPVPSQIPISLISGQGPKLIPGFIDEKMRQEVLLDQKTLYPAKLRFHRAWVEKFPRGRLIITENSGHGIPFEEPDLVIRTIHEMTLLPSSKTEQHPNGPIRKE